MTDLTGHQIGRYHILESLGDGGMATVYRARDTRLDRDVALKLIRVDQFAPAMMDHILARFEREAKSLARLSHNSIVRVYDYGEHDGAPYLVLEFCGGGDLKQRLSSQPMDWNEAIRVDYPSRAPCVTPTSKESSTGTSNPPTSCSTVRASRCSRILVSPRCWNPTTRPH